MADLPQSVLYAGPAALRSPRLAALFDAWQLACTETDGAQRSHPGLQAIDPIDLKPFLKDLIVVCVHDPAQPRFRLMGSGFREFFGGDFSGKPVEEAPLAAAGNLGETYRLVALNDEPRFGRHWWPACTGGIYQSEFVVLPYGEGTKVERLLVMEDLDDARRERIIAGRRHSA
jgi:hypothetical protein